MPTNTILALHRPDFGYITTKGMQMVCAHVCPCVCVSVCVHVCVHVCVCVCILKSRTDTWNKNADLEETDFPETKSPKRYRVQESGHSDTNKESKMD